MRLTLDVKRLHSNFDTLNKMDSAVIFNEAN